MSALAPTALVPRQPRAVIPAGAADSAHIDHPSGYLALSPRNQRFHLDGTPGFIAYRPRGRHWIMLGGPHAPPPGQGALLDGFVAAARAAGRRVLAVQVRADQVPLFAARGFTVNQLGSSYTLPLADFSLAGTPKMKLRNKIKRAAKLGLRVLEVGGDCPRTPATFDRLRAIDAAWLAGKRKKELDFMIGELGTPDEQQRRIFVVADESGAFVAYISYVPVFGARPGLLHDLTRKRPDAPVGAMELCNAHALAVFRREGVAHLHFGFTPFLVDRTPNPGRSPRIAWIMDLLRRRGAAIYPAVSQAAYKEKWGPSIVEREFVAGQPLGLRAIWDLLLLTRSI